MTFELTGKRVLINMIWGIINFVLFGTIIIKALVDNMIGAAVFLIALSGLFVVIPGILHVNYWRFDKDTLFSISKQGFGIKNNITGKEYNVGIDEIEKIFQVEPTSWRVPWMHEYAIIKLRDGKSLKISNYVIDPGEIIEILDLKKIVTRKEIFVPTIQSGTIDQELRTVK